MALEDHPRLVDLYYKFLDEGPAYSAFSFARMSNEKPKKEAVFNRLVAQARRQDEDLADRLLQLKRREGLERIFEAVDRSAKYDYLIQYGEFAPQTPVEEVVQVSQKRENLAVKYVLRPVFNFAIGGSIAVGSLFVFQLSLNLLFGGPGDYPPSQIPYTPPNSKSISARAYPTYLNHKQQSQLHQAGWKYVGEDMFEYTLEENDKGKGISQILKDTSRKLKNPLSPMDSGLLASLVATTEGSEVKNIGDGSLKDLRDSSKYIVKKYNRLRATSGLLIILFDQ